MGDVAFPPLFFDLTAPKHEPKPFAALYLSEYLVRLIGSEVTTFRRNRLASYHCVDTAHRVVGELQNFIDDVLNSGNVQSFKTWTKALTPLEQLLLDFNPNDFTGSDKLVNVSDRTACREDLEKWKKAREKTHEKLQSFHSQDNLKVSLALFSIVRSCVDHSNVENKELKAVSSRAAEDIKNVCRSDDRAFLDDLLSGIKSHTIPDDLGVPEDFKALFGQVPDWVSTIVDRFGQNKAFKDDAEALVAIQSTMAIYGWSHFATKSREDIKTLKHMWSDPVCSSAEELLQGLIDLGSDPPTQNIGSAQALYQKFINLAFISKGIPKLSCVDLMKLLNDIGRAYYAQALALITLCEVAVDYSNGQSEDSERVKSIEEALNKTSTALIDAANTAKSGTNALLGLPNWTDHKTGNDYDTDPDMVKFRAAAEAVVSQFTNIQGMATAIGGKTDFTVAKAEDKSLTEQANKRIKEIGHPAQAVKVTVEIKRDGSIQVGSSTLVSAIEWGVSNIPEVKQALQGNTAHFKSEDRETIDKHEKIDALLDPNGSLTLVMIITNNQSANGLPMTNKG
ncbi:hypothetical protein FRC12_000165 [Ceratobasidium sp. 428]|nr:hypothetical protein FRC12_000165 [Ceratobasidium sp. 428]